jgi:hypothetical protein
MPPNTKVVEKAHTKATIYSLEDFLNLVLPQVLLPPNATKRIGVAV